MPVKGKTLICKNQTYILDFLLTHQIRPCPLVMEIISNNLIRYGSAYREWMFNEGSMFNSIEQRPFIEQTSKHSYRFFPRSKSFRSLYSRYLADSSFTFPPNSPMNVSTVFCPAMSLSR